MTPMRFSRALAGSSSANARQRSTDRLCVGTGPAPRWSPGAAADVASAARRLRQSWPCTSWITSRAPARPRPESDGFSMKKRWQENSCSPGRGVVAEVAAVGLRHPALRLVGHVRRHDLVDDLRVHRRVGDLDQRLDAAGQVALHPVGRADVDPRPRRRQAVAVAEADDAAVLEEAADDRLHPDVLARARRPRRAGRRCRAPPCRSSPRPGSRRRARRSPRAR